MFDDMPNMPGSDDQPGGVPPVAPSAPSDTPAPAGMPDESTKEDDGMGGGMPQGTPPAQ
ncbi:hypothetical protein HYW32_01355 [Candidatus Berkelbacteria bacterium]|nr:hypothetical protein [Candidatus Berkelbacteria bacterium]